MKYNTKTFIQKCKELSGDLYDYSPTVYINHSTKVKVKCLKCNNILELYPTSVFRSKSCLSCHRAGKGKKYRKYTHQEFLNIVHKNIGDKYIIHSRFEKTEDRIDVTCSDCGFRFLKKAIKLLSNNEVGCPNCRNLKCARNRKYSVEKFEELCNLAHSRRYKYFQDYTGIYSKIKIECPKHGIFIKTANNHLNALEGCQQCIADTRSKGETLISQWLDDKSILYQREKKFDDLKIINHLRFDFYLIEHNVVIEFDGIQHYESENRWGGKEQFKKINKSDKIKDEYCSDNKIRIIRIPYWDIKNINSYLKVILRTKKICQ